MANSMKSRKTTQKIEFSLSAKFKISAAHSSNQNYQEMLSEAHITKLNNVSSYQVMKKIG